MAFVINVIKWLLRTVETMYFDVVEPVFISTITKSSLGSSSWATVLISSHPAMCETQCGLSTLPANTRHCPNAAPILAHSLRRWPSIVFAGLRVWASTSRHRPNVC